SGRLPVQRLHPAKRLDFFLQVFLAVAAIRQKKNLVRQKVAMNFREQSARLFGIALAGNYDLPRFAQAEIERDQQLRPGAGQMADLRTECVDGSPGSFAPALLIAKLREPQEVQRGDRTR